MICPACSGHNHVADGADRMLCVSQRVINGVPAGPAGNPGPPVIPVYGTCGHRFSRADGQRAEQQARELARQREESRRVTDDMGRREADPATPGEIRRLARLLLDRQPDKAHPLRVRVTKQGNFFRKTREFVAIAYRVWPVGVREVFDRGDLVKVGLGIDARGRWVRLDREPYGPVTGRTSDGRWSDPASERMDFGGAWPLAMILSKLEADWSKVEREGP